MNGELIWVLSLLLIAIILFATGKVRMDAVALLVIVAGALLLLPIVLWRGLLWQAEGWALGYAVALGGADVGAALHHCRDDR